MAFEGEAVIQVNGIPLMQSKVYKDLLGPIIGMNDYKEDANKFCHPNLIGISSDWKRMSKKNSTLRTTHSKDNLLFQDIINRKHLHQMTINKNGNEKHITEDSYIKIYEIWLSMKNRKPNSCCMGLLKNIFNLVKKRQLKDPKFRINIDDVLITHAIRVFARYR